MALNRPSFVRFNTPANPDPMPLEPVAEAPKEPRRPCPSCGNAMRLDAVLCLACGYNQASGERVEGEAAVEAPAAVPCASCGYDLRGLKADVCPECGEPLAVLHIGGSGPLQVLRPRVARREQSSSWAEWMGFESDVSVKALARPIGLLGVALLVITVQWVRAGSGRGATMTVLGAFAAMPVALVGHWIVAQIWDGIDASFAHLALQVASVSALVSAIVTLLGMPPPMILSEPISLTTIHVLAIGAMAFTSLEDDYFGYAISAIPITLAGAAGPIAMPHLI